MMRIDHRMHLVKIEPVDREYSVLIYIEQGNCYIDAKKKAKDFLKKISDECE